MKPRKQSPSKPKLNFTVDRSEFDISSDWVDAVMGPSSLPSRSGPFFSPDINNATETLLAPVEENPSVAPIAPVVNGSGVAINATGTDPSAAEINGDESVADSATVVNNTARGWKLRPLRRVTDGLTPGQYAVYSLMLANGEADEGGERLYRGGYADIGLMTGLSKRGIQNVIRELMEKSVIRLHTAPGHHRLQTSAYVVPKAESVLAGWFARGWRFATGKSKRLTNGATVALLATRRLA